MKRLFALLLPVGLLAGCAVTPPTLAPAPDSAAEPVAEPTVEPAVPAPVPLEPSAEGEAAREPDTRAPMDVPVMDDELHGEALFHVLAGELAAREGDLRQALTEYRSALSLLEDRGLVERTARLALYLGDLDAADEAVQRWQQLAPEDPELGENLALVQLRRGQTDAAVQAFETYLRHYADEPDEAFARIGLVLQREPQVEPALEVMQTLAARHIGQAQAQFALAQLALQAKQPALALAAAERASTLDPKAEEPLLARVRALLQLERGEEALKLLGAALKRQPQAEELRLQYARTLLNMDQPETALQQFELLLKSRPDDPQILYATALIALDLDQGERARGYLVRLINLGARQDEARYYLGRLAQAEDDRKGALRWYREVQGEHRPDSMLRIATLLAREGVPDAARATLRELREDYPEEAVRAFLVEGELLRSSGHYADAHSLYGEALQQDPTQPDLLYARALTAVELGRLREAEQDLRAVLAARPDSAPALNALGYTLVDRTSRHQEGFELIQRAYELAPEDSAVIDSMGWALYRLGQSEDALAYLQQAYELSPEAEIASHLVEVLWQLGHRAEARLLYKEALQQSPKDKSLLKLKERLPL